MNPTKLLCFLLVLFLFPQHALRAASLHADWYRFMGSAANDAAAALAGDADGNIYVGGVSERTWGLPINEHTGDSNQLGSGLDDVFIAKVSDAGELLWHTFLGANGHDSLADIAVDRLGNIYIAGNSSGEWGSPIHGHSGSADAFVAKLSSDGNLIWNTFMGSPAADGMRAIAVAEGGGIFATGTSSGSGWGNPINAHAGGADTFVVKLSNDGARRWHTFMGSASGEYPSGITVTESGSVVVAGTGYASWGTPVAAFSGGGSDAFVAKLDANGARVWNTFLGSSDMFLYGKSFYGDWAGEILIDWRGGLYVSGASSDWGTPLQAHTGDNNANTFVAKLDQGNGRVLWNTFIGVRGLNSFDVGATVNESGHVVVLIQSEPHYPPGVKSSFNLVKFDADGAPTGNLSLLQADSFSRLYNFVVKGNHRVYLAGRSTGAGAGTPRSPNAGAEDAVVLRYAPKSCYAIKSKTGRVIPFCL
ncbi:MAG: SBBP repeat-containing protein [Thiohalocapsa sp.]|nr:SBBP repeat-containing protein [Thiohalocapsa sp.]MCF7993171.1 SBBP repeat-containing protein [Thiohalocapsa sp.]